jgi:hypothetical protein
VKYTIAHYDRAGTVSSEMRVDSPHLALALLKNMRERFGAVGTMVFLTDDEEAGDVSARLKEECNG